MATENRHVMVEILAFEGVGDDGLVLHTHQVVESGLPEGEDRSFELPGRGVGRWKRIVPGNVVLEDGGASRVQRLAHFRQFTEAFDVRGDRLGSDAESGDERTGLRSSEA